MKQHLIILFLIVFNSLGALAQSVDLPGRSSNELQRGSKDLQKGAKGKSDSLGYDKVKPDVRAWILTQEYIGKDSVLVDTLMSDLQNFNPIYRKSVSNAYLGNIGSPYQSNIFRDRESNLGFLFLKPYEAYLNLPKDRIYFNTKTPFTSLSLATAGPKGQSENVLKVLHTQNINPNWNFGLNYNLISSDGQYMDQNTKIYDFNLFSSYEKGRYGLHLFLNQNRISVQQNGGIVDDFFVRDTTMDTQNIQVNLTDSRAKLTNMNFTMNHSYSLGAASEVVNGKDTLEHYPARFVYNMEYESDSYKFTENDFNPDFYASILNLDETSDKSEFSSINPDETFDKSEFSSLKNTFQMVLNENQNKWIRLGARAMLGSEIVKYKTSYLDKAPEVNEGEVALDAPLITSMDKNYHNAFVLLGVNSLSGDKLNWKAEGSYYFKGYRLKDYKLEASLTQWFDKGQKQHGLTFYGRAENRAANVFLNEYSSNHFQWKNNLESTKNLILGFKYHNSNWNLEIGGEANQVSDHIWFDSMGNPAQSDKNIRVLTAWMKKEFVLGNFHLNQKLVGQNSSDENVISLPEFSIHSNNYFQKSFINGGFEIQTGFSVFYNTAFYAPDFNPATGQFMVQNDRKLGDYPKVDLYFNFRIKRTRFFLMYEHVNSSIGSKNYFTSIHYPLNPGMFKYGLVWTFYN